MLLLFAVSAFSVQSSYYFAYTTIEDGDYSQWIRPNQTARFKFRLFEDGNLVDPAIEERMRLIGVYPYFYGIDSATVQQSNITSMFDETSWTFEIRASAPGQFCYRVRPNVETVWNIREASVCFGVSNIVTSPGNSIVGKIRKYDQIFGGEVIRGMAVALCVGIAVGTYASIFIATPIMYDVTMYAERRKEKKITQVQLAKYSDVSLGSIKRFERTGEISLTSLVKIAFALGCEDDFESLFARKGYASIEEVINEGK